MSNQKEQYSKSVDDDIDYTLRISTPGGCNLKCIYCRRENAISENLLGDEELLDIVKASTENGIKHVRWTGSEPTVMKNFVQIVDKSRNFGIQRQMLSTNGTILYKMAGELRNAGINRVNISLDTLKKEKFAEICGADLLEDVLYSIDLSTQIFDLVKLNAVLTKSTFEEALPLVKFTESYKDRPSPPVLRFIELVRGGFEGDGKFVEENYVRGEDVVNSISANYGSLTPVEVEGDNPMCYYYKIDKTGTIFGIVPNFSVKYQCAGRRCKKLRLNPTGFMSNCSIYQEFGSPLKGTTYKEKVRLIRDLIKEKQERGEEVFRRLKHYQSDYHFWRFGEPRDSS